MTGLKNKRKMLSGILSIVCAILILQSQNSSIIHAQKNESRGYVAGKYGIEIDGIMAGWVYSVEGGSMVSDLVEGKSDAEPLARKHIGGVKYEDITVSCGTGMSKGMYEWIKDSFDKKYSRKNGAIIACDYNYKEKSRIEFTNALITEIGFPALDAASKDACKMTLKFKPEITRYKNGSGEILLNQSAGNTDPKVQKKWLPANFRLKIDGLDDACKRVNKIEAIVVKQKMAGREPGKFEFPDLVITIPESSGKEFIDWQQNVTAKKTNEPKTGSLEYLLSDNQEAAFGLAFDGLVIESVTQTQIRGAHYLTVRMKVGRIEFKV